MPALPKKYLWVKTLLPKWLNTSFSNHTLYVGISESGKTYDFSWIVEKTIREKTHKWFLLNGYQSFMVEESLGFQFYNEDDNDLYKIAQLNRRSKTKIYPQDIKVKVYVPLTIDLLRENLPKNYIPFTIPVNDLDENCFQMLYGERDIQIPYSIYASEIKQSKRFTGSLPLLQNEFRKMAKRKMSKRRAFGGLKMFFFSEDGAKRTIQGINRRLNKFNDYGIMSSHKHPNCLKNFLKDDLKDPNTISVLDLSRIRGNREIVFLCIAYFLKALEDILEKTPKSELPYKIGIGIDEAKELLVDDKHGKSGVHKGLQELISHQLTFIRHRSVEYHISTQSPTIINEQMFKNIHTIISTHIENTKDREWVFHKYEKLYDKRLITDLYEAMRKLRETRNDFRFIVVGDKVDDMYSGRNPNDFLDVGYALPHPRMNFYQKKLSFDNKITSIYRINLQDHKMRAELDERIQQLGNDYHQDIPKAIKILKNEWSKEQDLIEAERKEESRERRERLEREEQKKQSAQFENELPNIQAIAKGIKNGLNVAQIQKETGLDRDYIRKRWGQAEQILKINSEKPQNPAITEKNEEKNLEKALETPKTA